MGKVILDIKEYEELISKKKGIEEELRNCILMLCKLHQTENYKDIKIELDTFMWENKYIA